MKKFLAILLSLALALSVLTACSQETEDPNNTEGPVPSGTQAPEETTPADPIEALPGSIYYFGYAVEGLGDLIQFYHFYPDDLGIGAVFYAGYAWNQITFSGTYKVEKTDCAYEVYYEKEGELQTGTAPYTITLYDWDGNELDQIGYDGTYVYNSAVNVNCDPTTGGGTYRQSKADEAALEAGKDTFGGEKGVAYMNFVSPDDETATLQLNTNGTYSDLVVMAVDGTWAKTGDNEYTLTPDSESDTGAVVTLQEDGSYEYAPTTGDPVTLELLKDANVFFTFAGKTPFMDSEADVTIVTYDDGTCVVNMAAFGAEVPIDQGTYEFDGTASFTFHFEAAGDISSEFGGETGVQVVYTCESVAAVGGAGVTATCGVVIG